MKKLISTCRVVGWFKSEAVIRLDQVSAQCVRSRTHHRNGTRVLIDKLTGRQRRPEASLGAQALVVLVLMVGRCEPVRSEAATDATFRALGVLTIENVLPFVRGYCPS